MVGNVSNQIKKSLLFTVGEKIGEYLAKLQARGCGCLVQFVHLATTRLKDEGSARDNHLNSCIMAMSLMRSFLAHPVLIAISLMQLSFVLLSRVPTDKLYSKCDSLLNSNITDSRQFGFFRISR